MLRRAGPQRAGDFGLRASAERTGVENASTQIHFGVSDRRAESLRIGGDKIPFKYSSEVAAWPIEIAELVDYPQGWTPSVRISHESNLLAIPKNDPDHSHVADVDSQSR